MLYCIQLYCVPRTEAVTPKETERPGRQKRGKSFGKHAGTSKFPLSSHEVPSTLMFINRPRSRAKERLSGEAEGQTSANEKRLVYLQGQIIESKEGSKLILFKTFNDLMNFMFLSAAEVSKEKPSPAPTKAGEFVSLGSC